MKFCKDCKHYSAPRMMPFTFCLHPDAKRNPVSGTAFTEFERKADGHCGIDGKLFEPKPEPVSFFRRLFARR